MKFIKSINELNEARQAPAKKLFKMVVKGSTSEIEGQKISKEMAQGAQCLAIFFQNGLVGRLADLWP